MTELLQRAIAEIQKLPADAQDAIAARILAELSDDKQWQDRFAATTDDQWQQIAAAARRDIDAGGVSTLDDSFPARATSQ